MNLETDKLLLTASLIDQMLDALPAISTFMKPEEYLKVDEFSNTLKSKEWFLDANFFKPLNLSKENNTLPFELTLYANPNSNQFSDALAIIPFEFQYIKRNLPEFDIIVLRMFLDATSFRIATMEVSEDVISSIEENFKKILNKEPGEDPSNIFDKACFLCVKEYVERIFRTKGIYYDDWNHFKQKIKNELNITINDFSDMGKYLWHTDYLSFDNRPRRNDKIITLVEQIGNAPKEKVKQEKIAEKDKPRKKGFFSFKSFFEK